MSDSSMNKLQRRQGYGAITDGLSSASNSLGDKAHHATSSLSQPQIVGVVVGILAIAVMVVGLTWYCCVRQAKKRDARNERERLEIRQREVGSQGAQHALPFSFSGHDGHGARNNAAALDVPAPQPGVQSSMMYERRGSELDEDYWKHEPLSPLGDQSHANGAYVVDFDEMGQPRYMPPSTSNRNMQNQPHLPGYGEAITPTHERQPFYVRS